MIVPPRRMAPGEHLTAANYNALLDYVRRITPRQGANVAVDYRLDGAVISGTPDGAVRQEETKPFTVRFDAELGKWTVYLPSGCMNVVQTCTPINTDVGGGWYSFALDETQGTTQTNSDAARLIA